MPGQIQADKRRDLHDRHRSLPRGVFESRRGGAELDSQGVIRITTGKPLDLVNAGALGKVPAPFSLVFKSQTPATDPNTALFHVERSDGGLER